MLVKLTLTESQARLLLKVLRGHKRSGEYWGNKLTHYVGVSMAIESLDKALEGAQYGRDEEG